jgi:hypothetical protein
MEETKIVVVVTCKQALTEADLRFLELDLTRRLQATLVQKLASVIFQREQHGNS